MKSVERKKRFAKVSIGVIVAVVLLIVLNIQLGNCILK